LDQHSVRLTAAAVKQSVPVRPFCPLPPALLPCYRQEKYGGSWLLLEAEFRMQKTAATRKNTTLKKQMIFF
jgi:hypothetical protein